MALILSYSFAPHPPPPHPIPMNHHGGITDEGFLHPPANVKDSLHHKDLGLDDPDHPVVSLPPTSSVSNNSTQPQLQKISVQQSSETVERKQGIVMYLTRCRCARMHVASF